VSACSQAKVPSGRNHPWRGALFALIACAFACPDRVTAQELWRGLELGASPKDVREVIPDATQPLSPVTLADGETDDLATHGIFYGDRLMEVRFFFRDGGLSSVQLTPDRVKPADRTANLAFAHALTDQLTSRYGVPFDCGDRSYADVGLYECKWLAKPIVIRLWYLDAEGQAPSIRIAFRKADDAAYDF
jgi:hypothetical protein